MKTKTRQNINTSGDAHGLTFSCYRRIPFFDNEAFALLFLNALELARKKHSVKVWAYVVMPEHVHVLLWPENETYDIGEIRKTIKQSVSRRAVRLLQLKAPKLLSRITVTWPTSREEHRFWQQGGGFDRNLFQPKSIRSAIDYYHDNPVRRGLCESNLDYKFSSAKCYAGFEEVPFKTDLWPGEFW